MTCVISCRNRFRCLWEISNKRQNGDVRSLIVSSIFTNMYADALPSCIAKSSTAIIRNWRQLLTPRLNIVSMSAWHRLVVYNAVNNIVLMHKIWSRKSDCFIVAAAHDDVIKWKHFPRYWPFVRGIHRPRVNSPHKGQWRGALMFSLICA